MSRPESVAQAPLCAWADLPEREEKEPGPVSDLATFYRTNVIVVLAAALHAGLTAVLIVVPVRRSSRTALHHPLRTALPGGQGRSAWFPYVLAARRCLRSSSRSDRAGLYADENDQATDAGRRPADGMRRRQLLNFPAIWSGPLRCWPLSLRFA